MNLLGRGVEQKISDTLQVPQDPCHPPLSLRAYRMAETNGIDKVCGISSSGAANGGRSPPLPELAELLSCSAEI